MKEEKNKKKKIRRMKKENEKWQSMNNKFITFINQFNLIILFLKQLFNI